VGTRLFCALTGNACVNRITATGIVGWDSVDDRMGEADLAAHDSPPFVS
jgi:hypothetical protein